jgi:hypothetical protein|tara:strand:- start:38 stop:598 length:561 start_codon:yes stop_codon:yes gene_type:complete
MIIAGAKISEYIDNKQKKIIMAFKMTPGIKGTPASNRIAGLGGCGGPGLPPCPPRFSAEKDLVQKVSDRKISDRGTRKATKKVVASPPPKPVKFKINLPKGYEFRSKKEEMNFYQMMEGAIDAGEFKSQEQLDIAIMKQLKGGKPKDPKDPVFEVPKEGPIKVVPVKGGESEAGLSKPKAKSVAAK